MAGASSEDIRLTKTIDVSGEIIPPRELCKGVKAKITTANAGRK